MNRNFLPLARAFLLPALILSCLAVLRSSAAETIPLAGEWRFTLDRNDAGTNGLWLINRQLTNQIQLPGILEAQGYGDEISVSTPWVLSLYDHFWNLRADYAADTNAGSVKVPFLCQPPRHYLGAAWYQRDIEIPADWRNQRVVLFLERPHWETTVWLDNRKIGSDTSLCTPHEYDLGVVMPGRHSLTIRVDNRMILPYRPDAHSVSDSLGNAWNGIAGRIELRATPQVWIDDVQIIPNVELKSVLVRVRIGNATRLPGSGLLFYPNEISPLQEDGTAADAPIAGFGQPVVWNTNGTNLEFTLPVKNPELVWDEFHPNLQYLDLELDCNSPRNHSPADRKRIVFGFRDFHVDGNQFILNGRPAYFRGTHFGGDFPLTGCPPTDVDSWKKIFQTCQDWGLNHMRFHSWCPPEAAFQAADEMGFYLQVECGMWNSFAPGGEMEKTLYSETRRILRAYGNHPSFVLLSASNEAAGRWRQVLPQWVDYFHDKDPRRLYTPDTGWAPVDKPGPVNGADYLAVGRIGPDRVRGESGWFGRDYDDALKGMGVPVISHEAGQWVAYPDFDVIKKFTGFLRPGNYEIFRDSAAAHGVLNCDKNFAWASGRFQLECYKEEIEANLRTRGLSGFQLLDLHDYMGQGTALVGLLDPFWESKGYATPDEFRKFCNTIVPLARLRQRVFTTADAFDAGVSAANFGPVPLTNATVSWQITGGDGRVVAQGEWPAVSIPVGKNFALGRIAADLSKLPAPAACKLAVTISYSNDDGDLQTTPFRFKNDWTFWLYPDQVADSTPTNVFVTSSWDDAEKKLSNGGRVLFLPRNADLDWWSPPPARVPVFWNALMGPTWGRMMGLWCDTNHPALAEFPTEANCDWQWTDLLHNARAVNLDRLPKELRPIVSAIDDWNRNYKLGVVFECKTGGGRLMVCSIDLDSRPGARQLRRSLMDYMADEKFDPPVAVPADEIRGLLFDTRIMKKLGATAELDGHDAGALVDGDPNTYSLSGDARGAGTDYPHTVTVHFPKPVALNGLVLMPRQNQREHQGDIREYTLQASDDGQQWRDVARGQLSSTWDPQEIHFPKTITAKHLKFTALSGFGADNSAALAELAVIYAGPKLADTGGDNIEYQKVRTASTDIDAGGDATNKPSQTPP